MNSNDILKNNLLKEAEARRIAGLPDLLDEPKTPHEEVMFVVESTNEIVSEFKSILQRIVEILEGKKNGR